MFYENGECIEQQPEVEMKEEEGSDSVRVTRVKGNLFKVFVSTSKAPQVMEMLQISDGETTRDLVIVAECIKRGKGKPFLHFGVSQVSKDYESDNETEWTGYGEEQNEGNGDDDAENEDE
eukprot:TRINITY_DN4137_c0_g1_i1.p1 TRINITY_DN4137_c0_g1~~TRINITY_DN4137_c0_g1_i1.p1  ORF type:complete len:120 (-),score=42.97 TRINITY_DN4137_c0_g1_i1:89-448(-)